MGAGAGAAAAAAGGLESEALCKQYTGIACNGKLSTNREYLLCLTNQDRHDTVRPTRSPKSANNTKSMFATAPREAQISPDDMAKFNRERLLPCQSFILYTSTVCRSEIDNDYCAVFVMDQSSMHSAHKAEIVFGTLSDSKSKKTAP